MSDFNLEKEKILLWVRYSASEVNDGYWLAFFHQRLVLLLVLAYSWAAILSLGYVQYSILPDLEDSMQLVQLTEPEYLPMLLIAALGIPLTVCAIIFILARSRVAKSFYIRPNFHFPMLYVIDNDGIQMQFASGSGLIEWRYFSQMIESAESFCLISTPKEVFVLPKRCFSGVDEMNRARELLKSKIISYKKVGGKSGEIVFEKAAIKSVTIDGEEFPVAGMMPPEAAELAAIAEDLQPAQNEDEPSSDQERPDLPASVDMVAPLAVTGQDQLEQRFSTGLKVEFTYAEGEIKEAQRIYFFRKVLVRLGLIYLALGMCGPLITTLIGWLWNSSEINTLIWGRHMERLFIIVVLYVVKAFEFYWRTVRTPDNDRFASKVGFNFNRAGCSMRTGEHYSMLAWLHFVECWETETQFLLLFGSGGRAMYVLPKRILNGEQIAFLTKLLQENVRRYKSLI